MPLFHSKSNFLKVAREGNEKFLLSGFSWNGAGNYIAYVDDKGDTALHAVAQGGLDRVMKTLIDAGAEVNTRNLAGETPLLTATYYQKTDAMKCLLENGADPNIATQRGQLPLDVAVLQNNAVRLKMLLDAGANPNNPNRPLLLALQYGYAEPALALLAAGAKADAHDGSYCFPIHYAAQYGALDAMKLLLKGGADINCRDAQGMTPLHYAALSGNFMGVDFLLSRGAAKDIEDAKGRTPLAIARELKNDQIVKTLGSAAPATVTVIVPAPVPAAGAQPVSLVQGADIVAPAAVPESAGTQGSETWMLLGEAKAAHVGEYPPLNRKITEIFNFATRERLIITENLKTGAETTTPAEPFDKIPEAAVRAATAAFTRLGGQAGPKNPLNL